MKSTTSSSYPRLTKSPSADKVKQQEAIAPIVVSPKGISKKTPINSLPPTSPTTKSSKSNLNDLYKQRRRLSLVEDKDKIADGENVEIEDSDSTLQNKLDMKKIAIKAFAGMSKKGFAPYNTKKKNQDAMVIDVHKETNSLLLCVFDGHGEVGDDVSHFLQAHFGDHLFAHPLFTTKGYDGNDGENIKKAMGETVQTLEKRLLKESGIDVEFSGTTAVICVIRGNVLVVGNIGDSRISRGYNSNGKLTAEQVSRDHKPDSPDEKKRILATGGRVFAVEYDDGIDGPPRVWLPHVDIPGLAMSRSLGDTVAHSAGVSSEAEFFIHKFTKDDRCIVVATDGLWEFLKDQDVIDIIQKNGMEAKISVDALVAEANARWMKAEQVIDDTTVIVANVEAIL